MSSSYFAISLIKQSNMPKEQLAIFLLNISKEALCDFLNELGILNKPTNLTKNKMIELIINDGVITAGNSINILTNNTERIRINESLSIINNEYNKNNKSKMYK